MKESDEVKWCHLSAVQEREIIRFIHEYPRIYIAIVILRDVRAQSKTSSDLYNTALRFHVERLVKFLPVEADVAGSSLPRMCIIDYPPEPGEKAERGKNAERGKETRDARERRRGKKWLFHEYQRWWLEGFRGRNNRTVPPLREMGFSSGLFCSHASENNGLQIADTIVGCFTEWVALEYKELLGSRDEYRLQILREHVKPLRQRFLGKRLDHAFVLFPPKVGDTGPPWERELWPRVKKILGWERG